MTSREDASALDRAADEALALLADDRRARGRPRGGAPTAAGAGRPAGTPADPLLMADPFAPWAEDHLAGTAEEHLAGTGGTARGDAAPGPCAGLPPQRAEDERGHGAGAAEEEPSAVTDVLSLLAEDRSARPAGGGRSRRETPFDHGWFPFDPEPVSGPGSVPEPEPAPGLGSASGLEAALGSKPAPGPEPVPASESVPGSKPPTSFG
ncbi:hypothetical protein CK936_33365, partial [Streptomyces albireticuli]